MADFISREAAEAAMTALRQEDIDAFGMVIPECFPSASAIEALKKIPAADVRPVIYGEWEFVSFMTVRCSNCKEIFHELESDNFCPNCGCAMENEK